MVNFLPSVIVLGLLLGYGAFGRTVEEEEPVISAEDSDEVIEETVNVNNTGKDLYVIRKVVYEIGILTESDNSTEFDNRTHEQIDVSFFDPIDNGTFIDLSNIPIPVETNVSGVSVTGILSSNLGRLVFPENGSAANLNESSFPLFPDKQVKVTRNVSVVDQQQSFDLLSGITDVLGLRNLVKHKEDNETTAST